AHLTERHRVIAVVAHQRRQVECGRQTGLAGVQQALETLVRLLGRTEPGEHPHRPRTAAVHALAHAPRVRERAGVAQVALEVEPLQVVWRVYRVDRDLGKRLERGVALRVLSCGLGVLLCQPLTLRLHAGIIRAASKRFAPTPSPADNPLASRASLRRTASAPIRPSGSLATVPRRPTTLPSNETSRPAGSEDSSSATSARLTLPRASMRAIISWPR